MPSVIRYASAMESQVTWRVMVRPTYAHPHHHLLYRQSTDATYRSSKPSIPPAIIVDVLAMAMTNESIATY